MQNEKMYLASCHCQKIKFKFSWDPALGIHKCNCTYCYKTKYQKVFVKHGDLELQSGDNFLATYHAEPSNWHKDHIHHHFCKNCGVQVYSKGFLQMDHEIFNGWFYAVNLATCDNITPEEIISTPVIFENGIEDNQMHPPKETRHL